MRYAKTPNGSDEIRGCSRSLSRPLRNVLLCANADRDSMAMHALAHARGASADALQLQGLRLITAADQSAAATKPLWNLRKGQSEPASDAQSPDTLRPIELGADTLSVSSDDYLRLHAHMEAPGRNRGRELLHDLSA